MTERITVPATLPGVVRRGTPVWAWDEETPWTVLAEGNGKAVCAPCAGLGIPSCINRGNLQVDLTDATGRAHVSWAIAAAIGECQWAPLVRWEHPDGRAQAWTIPYGANVCRFWYADTGRGPCIGLDWHDDTRLSDGSRRVDALALRAVALHVLGGDS